jgi:hypothetical protein
MDNLAKIIGPCPCEMTRSDLRSKLEVERTRVRDAIEEFLATPIRKRGAARTNPKTVTSTKLRKELAAAGITLEEFQQILKEQEKTDGQD